MAADALSSPPPSFRQVHHVSFNHGGSMLCIVTGKVLQLFSYYSTHDGLPAREYVLAGHTSDVIATVRTRALVFE
jgi:hypothetical protein